MKQAQLQLLSSPPLYPFQSMAPALTSNSFLFTTTPHSRTKLKIQRQTVYAKKAGSFFPFGKPADDDDEGGQDSGNSRPIPFDFGRLADVKSLVPLVASPSSGLSFGRQRRKDPGTVFVAGATGQAGIRIAQSLLRQGFSVRAGVPDLGAAQELARLASTYKIISDEELKRLNAVDSTFDDAESIAKAIGNASKVVVTIGPAENGPNGQVTASDALQVIQAAELANVGHVAIIYDASSGVASTYNVLDGISIFFNNLFAKSQPLTVAEFLQELVKTTDVSYTVIKTKLTDDFALESSYNLVVSPEGAAAAAAGANDYKVTKSQIASLVSDVFSNTSVAENKVVEVYTDPSAPLKAIDELLSAIPEDGRRKVYAETVVKAKAEEEAIKATEEAREAAEVEEVRAASPATEAQKKAEAEGASVESLLSKAKGVSLSWENLSSQLKSAVQKSNGEPKVQVATVRGQGRASSPATEAQKKAEAAGASVESLLSKAKGVSLSWENLSSQLKSAVQKTDGEPKVQVATVRGQAKARSLPSLKAVVKKPPTKSKNVSKPKAKTTESKKETRKVFGGLFQQETIYIDDE